MSLFSPEIYVNTIKTVTSVIFLTLLMILINIMYVRKIDSRRQQQKFRVRSFYVGAILLLLILAKIWVEGFAQLFTFLALIAAALVISNKETIMNCVGWLIIMWRSLFSEDDLIQVQHYKGYVKNIGLLFFEIAEVNPKYNTAFTGKLIKIPNGLLTTYPLINYSQTSNLLEQNISILIKPHSDLEQSETLFKTVIDNTLINFYCNKKEYSAEYIKRHNKNLTCHIHLGTVLSIKPRYKKPAGIKITARYYCFASDHEKIEQIIWHELFKALKNNKAVQIAYELV